MRTTASLLATPIVFFFLAVTSQGAELQTRLIAKKIQDAEEMIAVAIQVGDYKELKRQADELFIIGGKIADTEDIETRTACAGSAGTLRNVAEGMSQPGHARGIVAARRDLNLYRETMPMCEVEVGLLPPSPPNLRTVD